jgi:hypothetical protein
MGMLPSVATLTALMLVAARAIAEPVSPWPLAERCVSVAMMSKQTAAMVQLPVVTTRGRVPCQDLQWPPPSRSQIEIMLLISSCYALACCCALFASATAAPYSMSKCTALCTLRYESIAPEPLCSTHARWPS